MFLKPLIKLHVPVHVKQKSRKFISQQTTTKQVVEHYTPRSTWMSQKNTHKHEHPWTIYKVQSTKWLHGQNGIIHVCEILEYWLSQLLTVEEVGTANNSVERSSVIAWTGKQPLEFCRNVLPCRTKSGSYVPTTSWLTRKKRWVELSDGCFIQALVWALGVRLGVVTRQLPHLYSHPRDMDKAREGSSLYF